MRTHRLRLAALVAVPALALASAGCGTEDTVSDTDTGAGSTPAAQAPAPSTTTDESTSSAASASISKDLGKEPRIAKPTGQPPAQLVTRDIVKGTGPAIKSGQQATVRYVGVSYSTGQTFDASWNRGQDFPFPLGQGQVIPGWDQGIVGMKKGGRRELIIPPDLAYGPQGQPPTIQPNETLIFVVDLRKIG